MDTNLFFGVDVCKGRWAIAAVREDGGLDSFWIKTSFEEVVSEVKSKSVPLTLVDIPIGLKSSGSDERRCDREARRFVGKRSSSVFRVPVRQAVYAESREEASKINRQITCKGISVQSWGIVEKIKEVDRLLSQDPTLQSRVRETHPEVCFCGLNGGCPLLYSKRESAGVDKRLKILQRFSKDAKAKYDRIWKSCPRSQLGKDDVLDAMAAAITAWKCCQDKTYTFPETSTEKDAKELRMEIVYWRSKAD